MGTAEGGGVVSDYSDRAMQAATGSNVRPCHPTPGLARVFTALDAAHDREALGLDASARVGDTLNEVVAWLREATVDTFCTSLPDDLLREFEANEGER